MVFPAKGKFPFPCDDTCVGGWLIGGREEDGPLGFPKGMEMGLLSKKIGTNTIIHHKQTSEMVVAVLDMKIGVTVGGVNQVTAALVALQETTAPLFLVVYLEVVVDLETQTNIRMV